MPSKDPTNHSLFSKKLSVFIFGDKATISPTKPIQTANKEEIVNFSFRTNGESKTVIKGKAKEIIVASTKGNLDSEAKKQYVIKTRDKERSKCTFSNFGFLIPVL